MTEAVWSGITSCEKD